MIPADRYESLGELLHDSLIQYKSETALIEFSRKREAHRWTYLDFMRRGQRLARGFQDLGVGAGDRVAIVMSNRSAWLLSAYAAFYRGAVVVPIDYKLEGDEQETLLAHAEPKLLCTEYGEWRSMPSASKGEAPYRTLVADVPASTELPAGSEKLEAAYEGDADFEAPDFVPRTRQDQATLVYSSGTGGKPKGCMLTHDNYLEQYRTLMELFPIAVGDRYFSILPTNHAIDFMCGFVGPFGCGATVVHQRSLRPELIRHVMQKHRITHMAVVPLILEAFERRLDEKLDEQSTARRVALHGLRQLNAALTLKKPRREVSKRLLKPVLEKLGPDLRLLFSGGAFVDEARARRFYELGLPVVIGYGLTEACTVLTVNDLKPFRADSVGAPVDGVEMQIRDADAGGIGEVWVRGRTVFAGYYKDPDQTAEVLQDGWLRTGDRGYLDPSGHLHLVGRSKNMIVTAGGKNIYPEDIESAFDGLDCEELVVFAKDYLWPRHRSDALVGEELIAVVRPKESDEAGWEADLRKRNRTLPDFKRVSGYLLWDDEFPRTASMKVKRGVLADTLRKDAAPERLQELRS
ncbi:MAG: AMP-binding protein [Myxococcota bacterium]